MVRAYFSLFLSFYIPFRSGHNVTSPFCPRSAQKLCYKDKQFTWLLKQSKPMAPSAFSGSLFGGSSSAPSTGAQQPTASIFSSSNAPSAFGNTTTTTTGQAPSSFSILGQQSQQQQQPQQSQMLGQNQQPPSGQSMSTSQSTQPAFFNSLLERGKKRPFSATAQDANFGELPSLQLGLDDIRRKARELGAGGPKASHQAGRDSKA